MSQAAPLLAVTKPIGQKTLIVPSPAAPVKEWRVEIVTDRAGLEAHEPVWEILAKEAVEPNPFHEPWMFLPAAPTFDVARPLCGVFVYRHDPRRKQPPQLCGFFPFERRHRFRGLPIRSLRLWEHKYAILGTPLVHRDWARETLNVLFDWIETEERCAFVDLPNIHGEGPFHQALLDMMRERRMLSFVDEIYTRAMVRRGADAESYAAAAMNHLSRKEWRRQRKRLAEKGVLETRVLASNDDAEPWIDQFLQLEASGWKGAENTALAVSETDKTYFRTIARSAFTRGKLHMLGIFLDDKPIALKCNFLAGSGGFTFKIAFDEAYAKFSPGVQLELDNIEELHRLPGTEWMDSCAVPGHFMINRLWKERRTIQSVLLATSRFTGNGVVGALPMLRALKRIVTR